MQQFTYCLGIQQSLIPVYHPASNPEERKNRDLKIQISILVQRDHTKWDEVLPSIRFSMNTVPNLATGYSPAYLNFARELRTPTDVHKDLRAIIASETVIPEITPYLRRHTDILLSARENNELRQDSSKLYADKHFRETVVFNKGQKVLVKTHILSKSDAGLSSKFAPRRDGPYLILNQLSPTSYELATLTHPDVSIGKYHVSALHPFVEDDSDSPVTPLHELRSRGRPSTTLQKDVAAKSRGAIPKRHPKTTQQSTGSGVPVTTTSDSSSTSLPTQIDCSIQRPRRSKRPPKRYQDAHV
uniref:Uncharacterized protein LOC114340237 n=1 Tax=Diabrotica virgifera virgifera TaxID=50390 RepID=A0A6P7GSH1_DIAVI